MQICQKSHITLLDQKTFFQSEKMFSVSPYDYVQSYSDFSELNDIKEYIFDKRSMKYVP